MNWWRRLSIVAKLPLGIGALLLLMLGGMTAIVYVDVRRAALEVASERMERVSLQLVSRLGTQSFARTTRLGELARLQVVSRYLTTPNDSLERAVEDALRAYVTEVEGGVAELRDMQGRRLMGTAVDSFPLDQRQVASAVAAMQSGTRAVIGPMVRVGDRVVYSIVAPIVRRGAVLGYISDRRPITGSAEEDRAVAELFAPGAKVLVGNVAGDVWTDLTGTPAEVAPEATAATEDVVTFARADGVSVLARALGIPGTRWLLLAEIPRAPVFASARSFLTRSIIVSVVLAIAGALVAFIMSRRISLPLRHVTEAAEVLAAGGEVDPVHVSRSDEVGRLAASFNAMANEVQRSQQLLEQRVEERTAALRAVNSELESFSYSVSHDLRAPLRAVDGFAAILEEDHGDELSADAQRYLVRIRTSAQQMGALIDDLLAFSRLGRQPISRGPVDMEGLARAVVEEACRLDSRDPSEVHIGPLPPAHGERSMLKQVFANLVQNALKFTRGRQPARVTIGSRTADGETVYYVSDDGVGFDMQYADKLFGVFQRLHPQEEFEGTGVGLAVVKRVVERHGGRIWAESAPMAGATFYFTIPSEAPSLDGAVESEGAAWK